jgi:hypothetical protein
MIWGKSHEVSAWVSDCLFPALRGVHLLACHSRPAPVLINFALRGLGAATRSRNAFSIMLQALAAFHGF